MPKGQKRAPPVIDRIRCNACGTWDDPQERPHGGEYVPKVTSTTINSVAVTYNEDGGQGCWFCGSPDWQGAASLGDFNR